MHHRSVFPGRARTTDTHRLTSAPKSRGAKRNMVTPHDPPLSELLVVLRLEVAKVNGSTPGWWLLDFVHDDGGEEMTKEVLRVISRFNRITLSLQRQQGGHVARNEPYRDCVGVRCRMGHRVLGVWPSGPHERALTTAPTAPSDSNPVERDFESWRARALQKSRVSRKQSEPPPCRANLSDSKASSDE